MDEKFIKKTAEEFEAMSSEEQTKYLAAKEAHDAKVIKETAEKAGKEAAEKALKELPESISKETFDAYQKKTDKMIENLGKASGNKEEAPMTSIAKQFEEQYKERTKDLDKNELVQGNITMKAWTSTDTMVATEVSSATYPAAGAHSVVSGVLGFFTRLIPGFYRKPKPVSKIYDYVTVVPTEGETSVTVLSEKIIGEAELVDECELKPIVKAEYKATTVEMQFVAVFWKISRMLIRVFKRMGVDLQNRFNELILEKIPTAIADAVKDAAVPFTAVPELAIHSAPNNFDAIVAVIAYLEKLGYTPNAALLSPYAYANMITLKAAGDGHYMLSNGGSIKLVGSSIDYGGTMIELVKDATLGNDDLIIGDLSVVQAFIDGSIEYHQGYNDNDDLRRNLVGNVLEQLMAVVIPDGAETGIVSDTFANIKNLITAE
ncbi:hypothetical protein [Chryseobacterium sp. R2A-55]|uniref:hypothetical protein n=1 Tax=Chryseobacterium sp. R2A-55 TaxID=2744445 RepID=UPI001F18653F|nr:hypothetical protein [Chryseobacterium sp. R2A-55]